MQKKEKKNEIEKANSSYDDILNPSGIARKGNTTSTFPEGKKLRVKSGMNLIRLRRSLELKSIQT